MAKKPQVAVTRGSGNVFADLGLANPEEELAKAQLASRIREVVRERGLTQVAAAALMGLDQPKVSALLGGRLTTFSSGRLMRLLTRLGQDVEIIVRAAPHRRPLRRGWDGGAESLNGIHQLKRGNYGRIIVVTEGTGMPAGLPRVDHRLTTGFKTKGRP